MAHASEAVANKFLEKAGADGLDPMKLLKLTYLAQGWMLGLYGIPLIWNDVEAWRYGPVFREIYKRVAGRPVITECLPTPKAEKFDANESDLINQVWDIYGGKSGLQLSALTHAAGSPWYVTYHERGQNSVIPKSLMRDYYSKKVA